MTKWNLLQENKEIKNIEISHCNTEHEHDEEKKYTLSSQLILKKWKNQTNFTIESTCQTRKRKQLKYNKDNI